MSCGVISVLHSLLDVLDSKGIEAEIVGNRVLIRKHLPDEILPLLPVYPDFGIILTREYESSEIHLVENSTGNIAINLSWGKIDKIAKDSRAIFELATLIRNFQIEYDDISLVYGSESICYRFSDSYGYAWIRNHLPTLNAFELREDDNKPLLCLRNKLV